MMRHETTERYLFGDRDIKVWASDPTFVKFEKGDAKVQVKLVEFDYGTGDEHVLIEVATNGPECPNVRRGVRHFKQSDLTKVLIRYMKMNRRDLQRSLGGEPDALLHTLTFTLQMFTLT